MKCQVFRPGGRVEMHCSLPPSGAKDLGRLLGDLLDRPRDLLEEYDPQAVKFLEHMAERMKAEFPS